MSKKYSITIERNGEKIETVTDDIKKAIIDSEPKEFLTDAYISIEQDSSKTERVVKRNIYQNMFRIDPVLDVFINNLLLQNGK